MNTAARIIAVAVFVVLITCVVWLAGSIIMSFSALEFRHLADNRLGRAVMAAWAVLFSLKAWVWSADYPND